MKAIILARVSTEEQMNEGQSIPAQLERSREYAKRKGFEIKSEYQFDESSTKDHRKKFEMVIKEIQQSKEKIALIVETVDRLQRGFKESVVLEEYRKSGHLEIHFIRENLVIHQNSNSSEIQRWDLAVFVAKSYVLQVSDNVKRTFERKVNNGEIRGPAPVGYLNERDELDNSTVVVDKAKGHLVSKVFELYATGNYSMQQVADRIAELGFRTRKGAVPKARQIESILNNPFYYGFMRTKHGLKPHKYKHLTTEALFNECLEVRRKYSQNRGKKKSKPFALKGLIKCRKCGCSITPEIQKGKYIYYRCTNYKGICERIWIPEKELLEPLKDTLKKISLPQETIDGIVKSLKTMEESKNQFHTKQLSELRREYDKLDNRMTKMYEDRLDGRITEAMYDKMLHDYKARQNEISYELGKYKNANTTYYLTANKVLSIAQRAHEIFESSEPEEKRQLLNFVFQNSQLDGRKLLFKLKTPFDTVLSASTNPQRGG